MNSYGKIIKSLKGGKPDLRNGEKYQKKTSVKVKQCSNVTLKCLYRAYLSAHLKGVGIYFEVETTAVLTL